MNEKALESFIGLCNEMMVPVEEGFIGKLKNWRKRKKEIEAKKKQDEIDAEKIKKELDKKANKEKLYIMKNMQNTCVSYLKSYIENKDFVNKYKDYLCLIDITPEKYGKPYSIQITGFQDGVDWDLADEWNSKNKDTSKKNPYFINEWYDELLTVGEDYLNKTFKKDIDTYNIRIGTGDGDEGNIYIR